MLHTSLGREVCVLSDGGCSDGDAIMETFSLGDTIRLELDLRDESGVSTVSAAFYELNGGKGFMMRGEIAQEMAERYRVESEAALREVHDHLPQETAPDGKPWNWNADAHIRAVLRLLGANLDKKAYPKTEKTGDPSTSADALRTIKKPEQARQWVDAYLKYGTLRKQYNDFARQYASLIRPDGTIKGSFDTVSTGRLSCRKPNLQQVPSRGKRQSEGDMRIRDIFRPAPGDKFIVADFS